MKREGEGPPLGLRADLPLTVAQERALQDLERFDLSAIRERLLRDGAMPAAWLDDAILEFRRYLSLHLLVGEPVTMLSKPIDTVWHTCLLFSRLYADLCQQVFGHFVHHDPATDASADRGSRWQAFAAAYARYYGPPGRLWQMGRPAVD